MITSARPRGVKNKWKYQPPALDARTDVTPAESDSKPWEESSLPGPQEWVLALKMCSHNYSKEIIFISIGENGAVILFLSLSSPQVQEVGRILYTYYTFKEPCKAQCKEHFTWKWFCTRCLAYAWPFNSENSKRQFSYLENKDENISPTFWESDEPMYVDCFPTVLCSSWKAALGEQGKDEGVRLGYQPSFSPRRQLHWIQQQVRFFQSD